MSDTAPKPTGSDEAAIYVQEVWENTHGSRSRLRDSSTIKWQRTPRGVFGKAIVPPSKGSTPGIQGPFQIQSVQGDYLTCLAYNLDTKATSGDSIYIAKEWKHRQSLATETIFGVVHNYTYQAGTAPPGSPAFAPADAGNVFRTDTSAGNVEYQRIVPPWVYGAGIGEIIYAKKATVGVQAGDGTTITLLIDSRSCQWAEVNS